MSIGYKTPAEVHRQQEAKNKMWKNQNYGRHEVESEKECVSWPYQIRQVGLCVSSMIEMLTKNSIAFMRLSIDSVWQF